MEKKVMNLCLQAQVLLYQELQPSAVLKVVEAESQRLSKSRIYTWKSNNIKQIHNIVAILKLKPQLFRNNFSQEIKSLYAAPKTNFLNSLAPTSKIQIKINCNFNLHQRAFHLSYHVTLIN